MTGPAQPDLVWITGASSGIGRALALRLARDGRRVAASARRAEELASLAAESGGRIMPYPLDVTDRDAVAAAVRSMEAAHGPIGLAILNAGTHLPMSADDFSAGTFRRLIEVNLMGVVHGLDAVLAS